MSIFSVTSGLSKCWQECGMWYIECVWCQNSHCAEWIHGLTMTCEFITWLVRVGNSYLGSLSRSVGKKTLSVSNDIHRLTTTHELIWFVRLVRMDKWALLVISHFSPNLLPSPTPTPHYHPPSHLHPPHPPHPLPSTGGWSDLPGSFLSIFWVETNYKLVHLSLAFCSNELYVLGLCFQELSKMPRKLHQICYSTVHKALEYFP